MKIFKKILIANRGEIASRVIRAARELNIRTVAIYSKQDADFDFVKDADEAVELSGESIAGTYLNADQLIEIAKKYNVDAIHPGYGFLSENAEFARKCISNNIIFIGPDADSIEQMGDKLQARRIAESAQVPVLESITGETEDILKIKNKLSYPLMIKASAGGGGKGMKVITQPNELEEALWVSKKQALAYFGNDEIYLERYLENPKHIEVQVFGDNFGNHVHLFERECSIQRRHQKIIEESPSPNISEDLRNALTTAALRLVKKINYKNAGTIEFLVQDNAFFFLEMNTRIQVEHPVTEETTGIDLVKEQIRVAQGKPLSFVQKDIKIKGRAIQCRIYAEDPVNGFTPSPGEIICNVLPKTDFYRIDTICHQDKFIVPSDFDPMLSKLITSDKTRLGAIKKMDKALSEYVIHGIRNNVSYLNQIVRDRDFIEGKTNNKYIENHHKELIDSIHEQKGKIPLYLPLIATFLFKANSVSTTKNIWEKIGRWKAIDTITGIINDKKVQCSVVSNDIKSLKLFVDDQFIYLKYSLVENNRMLITYKSEFYQCIVSRYKQNNLFEVNVRDLNFIVERNDLLRERSLDEYLSDRKNDSSTKSNGFIKSPLNGKAIKVNFKNGDKVVKGDTLLVIESMKTENKIIAEREGVISELSVLEGEQVKGDQLLLRVNKD